MENYYSHPSSEPSVGQFDSLFAGFSVLCIYRGIRAFSTGLEHFWLTTILNLKFLETSFYKTPGRRYIFTASSIIILSSNAERLALGAANMAMGESNTARSRVCHCRARLTFF